VDESRCNFLGFRVLPIEGNHKILREEKRVKIDTWPVLGFETNMLFSLKKNFTMLRVIGKKSTFGG